MKDNEKLLFLKLFTIIYINLLIKDNIYLINNFYLFL